MDGGYPSHPSTKQSFVGGGGGGAYKDSPKNHGRDATRGGAKSLYISLQNTLDHMLHHARHNRLHHATIDHVARPPFWAGYPTFLRVFFSLNCEQNFFERKGSSYMLYLLTSRIFRYFSDKRFFFRVSLMVNSSKRSWHQL